MSETETEPEPERDLIYSTDDPINKSTIKEFQRDTGRKSHAILNQIYDFFIKTHEMNKDGNEVMKATFVNDKNTYCILDPNYLEMIMFYLVYLEENYERIRLSQQFEISSEGEIDQVDSNAVIDVIILKDTDFHYFRHMILNDYKNVWQNKTFRKRTSVFLIRSSNDISAHVFKFNEENEKSGVKNDEDGNGFQRFIFVINKNAIVKRLKNQNMKSTEQIYDWNDEIVAVLRQADNIYLDESLRDVLHLTSPTMKFGTIQTVPTDRRIFFLLSSNILLKSHVIYDITQLSRLFLRDSRLSDPLFVSKYGIQNALEIISRRVHTSRPKFDYVHFHKIGLETDIKSVLSKFTKQFFQIIQMELEEVSSVEDIDRSKYVFHKNDKLNFETTLILNEMHEFINAYDLFWFDPIEAITVIEKIIPSKTEFRNSMNKLANEMRKWIDRRVINVKNGFYYTSKLYQVTDVVFRQTHSNASGIVLIIIPNIRESLWKMFTTIVIQNLKVLVDNSKTTNLWKNAFLNVGHLNMFRMFVGSDSKDQYWWSYLKKDKMNIVFSTERTFQSIGNTNPSIRKQIKSIHTFSNKFIYSPVHQQKLLSLFTHRSPNVHVYVGNNPMENQMVTKILQRKMYILQEMNTRPSLWEIQYTLMVPHIELIDVPYLENFITTSTVYDTENLTPLELMKLLASNSIQKLDIPFIKPICEHQNDYKINLIRWVKSLKERKYIGNGLTDFIKSGISITRDDVRGMIELLFIFWHFKAYKKSKFKSLHDTIIVLLSGYIWNLKNSTNTSVIFDQVELKTPLRRFLNLIYGYNHSRTKEGKSFGPFSKEKIIGAMNTPLANIRKDIEMIYQKSKWAKYLNTEKNVSNIGKKELIVLEDDAKKVFGKLKIDSLVMGVLNEYFMNPSLLIFLTLSNGLSIVGQTFLFRRLFDWYKLYGEIVQFKHIALMIEEIKVFIHVNTKEKMVFVSLKSKEIEWF